MHYFQKYCIWYLSEYLTLVCFFALKNHPLTVFVFSSKKYVLTLVPIFVVCPALAFILWLTRHRIAQWLPCCKKAAAAALADKDGAKVEDANGEFFQVLSKTHLKIFESLLVFLL